MTHSPGFDSRIRAILGPTNTGKTYLAIERMLAHPTGMIGFPLRLLARENYDRIVKLRGKASVALVTGEEKIIPANPRWYVCTVEAMPLEKTVDFLAVDEIQLCGDEDRGHIFTDRLLYARGRHETMFLGSDTMASLIERVVGDVEIESRSRFSTLSYNGTKKLTRLPPRSAIVAFSVNDVYALAETIRMQNGGTAVVLGALSPRTRNAQVAMYQAGEVDYLVATDAIGMGLNMDVDHVAFASVNKYDGRRRRALTAAEMGQIAGRAGRHMNDGTFGMTNNKPEPEDEVIEAIESHEFPTMEAIFWRNRNLDFSSSRSLLKSLQYKPRQECLIRTRDAEDHLVLAAMNRKEEILMRAITPDQVYLLWDICQIPDFRKVMPDHHAEFLSQVYLHLADDPNRLPEDWVSSQIDRLDREDGDIDTLTSRIAHIRTWSYIANRANWMDDPFHWQGRTREIEDRLSDALHQRLLQRFVDKRASALMRKKKDKDGSSLLSAITSDGFVVIEGHTVGQMEAFRFVPDRAADLREARALTNAAAQAIAQDADQRVTAFEKCADHDISLSNSGTLFWRNIPIAKLRKGSEILTPEITLLPNDLPPQAALEGRILVRLQGWLGQKISPLLKSLEFPEKLKPSAHIRGLLFQLREHMGTISTSHCQGLLDLMGEQDKNMLARLKIRTGKEWVFSQKLLNDEPLSLRMLLFSLWHDQVTPDLPDSAPALMKLDQKAHPDFHQTGYIRMGQFAIKVDHYEAATAKFRHLRNKKAFAWKEIFPQLLENAPLNWIESFIRFMGCDYIEEEGGERSQTHMHIRKIRSSTPRLEGHQTHKTQSKTKKTKGKKGSGQTQSWDKNAPLDPNSPFAILQDLKTKTMNDQPVTTENVEKLRIDKWLWFARFFKTRTLAASIVTGGHLRVNKQPVKKPSYSIKVGDILTFSQGDNIRVIKISALGTRRGPAKEAQNLYEDLEPIVPKQGQDRTPSVAQREKGAGRPTKKERRQTQKLRDM